MTTRINTREIVLSRDPFETLRQYGAVYEPITSLGEYKGPLVAPGGTYTGEDGKRHPYVVRTFYNFSQAMQYPRNLAYWAQRLTSQIINVHKIQDETLYIGMPKWGHFIALMLAHNSVIANSRNNIRAIQVEKKLTAKEEADCPAEYSLIVNEYQVYKGDKVILVEDVVQSLGSAVPVIKKIEELGAEVVAIACVCARSTVKYFWGKPIIALAWKDMPRHRISDPIVTYAVRKYGVELHPEANWEKLMSHMPQPKK